MKTIPLSIFLDTIRINNKGRYRWLLFVISNKLDFWIMRMRQMQRYHDFIDEFILSYYVNKVHMEVAKITMAKMYLWLQISSSRLQKKWHERSDNYISLCVKMLRFTAHKNVRLFSAGQPYHHTSSKKCFVLLNLSDNVLLMPLLNLTQAFS